MVPEIVSHYMRSVTNRVFSLPPTGCAKATERLGGLARRDVPLLYVHVPFCETLCPYCSFNRVGLDEHLAHAYFDALGEELRQYHRLGFRFRAAYIGGGTPTVLPQRLCETVETLRRLWPIDELSVETNPNHLQRRTLEALHRSAADRVSVGVQTFQDRLLNDMNRLDQYGSGAEIRGRLKEVKGQFDTLNADMIFNLPGQTGDDLRMDLDDLLSLQIDQVTFYPLMASRETRAAVERDLGSVSRDHERRFYRSIVSALSADYERASAWCFSKAGGMIDEYVIEYPEFAAAGAGSFGYVGGTLYANTFSLSRYVRTVRSGILPVMLLRPFSRRQRALYRLLMELFSGRVKIGAEDRGHADSPFPYALPEIGLLLLSRSAVLHDRALELTERGYYYVVSLMREFFNGVNNLRFATRAEEAQSC